MVDMVTWQPGGETGHGRHGHLATGWRDRTWSTWSPGNLVERQRGLLISWDPQEYKLVIWITWYICFGIFSRKVWQWVRYTGGHLWPRGPWGDSWSFYRTTTRKCVLFAIKSSLLILDFLIFLLVVSQENVLIRVM